VERVAGRLRDVDLDQRPVTGGLFHPCDPVSGSEMMASIIGENIVEPLVSAYDGTDPSLRAELLCAHLVGLALTRYVLQLEPVASADRDTLTELVIPALQDYNNNGSTSGP
jgi:hypothetical protein